MNKRYCEECGKEFSKINKKIRFCSKKCANIKKARLLSIAHREQGKWNTCAVCKKQKPKNAFSFNIRNDFTSGKKTICKRCGANARESNRRNRTWKDDAVTILLSNSRMRSKRNGHENTLQRSDIIIPELCPVLGIPLFRENKKLWNNAPSIDRIDNTKGYTKDNIVIISRRANILKKDATIDELIKIGDFYRNFKEMNIFILDKDPALAAKYLCDIHVVRMILESFQMLSTVHRVWGSTENLYKITHIKHPCVIWLLQSASNYKWLVKHVEAMHEEYKDRYHKEHKSFIDLYSLVKNPPARLEDKGLTPFALAMPEPYRKEDPVLSYRLYYVCCKLKICTWKYPAVEPYWFKEVLNNVSFYL